MARSKVFTFRRFGRSYHLKIETGDDLERVLELDDAHWVASGAPTSTINCDPGFLELVDSDNNTRILPFEVRNAVSWLLETLRDRGGIDKRSDTLRIDALNTECEQGRAIERSVRKILARSRSDQSEEITLDHVCRVKGEIEETPVSDRGVVLPKASGDPQIRDFLADIVSTVGGAGHPSGAEGAGEQQLTDFLTQAKEHLKWRAKSALPSGEDTSAIMPLGADTVTAFELYASVRGKIDQYFAQCEAIEFDPRISERIGVSIGELQAMDFDDPKAIDALMGAAPIAKANPEHVLSFDQKINPYYLQRLGQFREKVLKPVLGEKNKTLSVEQWGEVKECFAAHDEWIAAKAGGGVESLGAEKLQRYLEPRFPDTVRSLIARSSQTAIELDNVRLVEKLILYQMHLLDLVNNFVSFPHLYDANKRAMFEMGTLVMDGRCFNFSVAVRGRAEHKKLTATSNIFALYVEIAPPEGEKYEVVVPVTAGGKGNLCVGKRGVFLDLSGNELDARVVEIIENPISIREALVSPFRRVGRLLTGKIEAISTAAEKKLDTATTGVLDQAAVSAPGAGANRGLLAGGLLMGGGVAVAVVGSAFAYVTKTLSGVMGWKIALWVGGGILAILLPISIVALLKLRRRDLSAILEGSGWAINARMRLTLRQSRFFTSRPRYPSAARGIRPRWFWWVIVWIVLIVALIIAGIYRTVDRTTPEEKVTLHERWNTQRDDA